MRGGELQCEREPVEPPADRRDVGGGSRVVDVDGNAGGPRPLEEHPAGRRCRHGRRVVRGRQRERLERPLELRAHPQRCPAGGQHDETRAARHQLGDPGGRADHLLEVVEDDEQPPVAERVGEPVDDGAVGLPDAESAGDRRQHEARLAQRGELDDRHLPLDVAGQVAGDGEGERGLTHTARAGQREQPRRARAQQAGQLGADGVPTHQLPGRVRQPLAARLGCHVADAAGVGAGRRRERSALGVVEGEGVGERADGVRVGTAAITPLQRADRLRGEAGAGGQLLLAQRAPVAETAQQIGEAAGAARAARRVVHRSQASSADALWARCGGSVGGSADRRPPGSSA